MDDDFKKFADDLSRRLSVLADEAKARREKREATEENLRRAWAQRDERDRALENDIRALADEMDLELIRFIADSPAP